MRDLKFDLSDITIIPTVVSDISSRSSINIKRIFNKDYYTLPLMASPMDTVVSIDNIDKFIDLGIIPCLPRIDKNSPNIDEINNKFNKYSEVAFKSFGLAEIEEDLINYNNTNILYNYNNGYTPFYYYSNVLIDIANGHMQKLVDIVKSIKSKFPSITLMVGNVANPLTYKNLAMAGADYIRCGIGSGNACVTSANAAVHYPMGSLIQECRKIKIAGGYWNCNIVADGGMKGYSDVIKIIGLGADYVMVGSLFNKSIESAGFNYLYGMKLKSNKIALYLWNKGFTLTKKYRGMSTKEVQTSLGKKKLTTSEGITRYQKIEYTLKQWTENFSDYLKSTMSYSGSKNLESFCGYAEYVHITSNSLNRFNK